MPRDTKGITRAIAAQRAKLDEAAAAEWMVTAGGLQFFPPTADRRTAARWLSEQELFHFAIARNDDVRIRWKPNTLNPVVKQRIEAERTAAEQRQRELDKLLPKVLGPNRATRRKTPTQGRQTTEITRRHPIATRADRPGPSTPRDRDRPPTLRPRGSPDRTRLSTLAPAPSPQTPNAPLRPMNRRPTRPSSPSN